MHKYQFLLFLEVLQNGGFDNFNNPCIGHLARLWAKHFTSRDLISCGPYHSPPGKHPAFSFSRWGNGVLERVGPPSRSHGHLVAGRPLDLKPHSVFREEAAGSGGSNVGFGVRQADGG